MVPRTINSMQRRRMYTPLWPSVPKFPYITCVMRYPFSTATEVIMYNQGSTAWAPATFFRPDPPFHIIIISLLLMKASRIILEQWGWGSIRTPLRLWMCSPLSTFALIHVVSYHYVHFSLSLATSSNPLA